MLKGNKTSCLIAQGWKKCSVVSVTTAVTTGKKSEMNIERVSEETVSLLRSTSPCVGVGWKRQC